uniref:Uncharacterized protein n=1 Tax=Glossina austeni TaxID=7395 RepID=A0A1A9UDX6_GLOAU
MVEFVIIVAEAKDLLNNFRIIIFWCIYASAYLCLNDRRLNGIIVLVNSRLSPAKISSMQRLIRNVKCVSVFAESYIELFIQLQFYMDLKLLRITANGSITFFILTAYIGVNIGYTRAKNISPNVFEFRFCLQVPLNGILWMFHNSLNGTKLAKEELQGCSPDIKYFSLSIEAQSNYINIVINTTATAAAVAAAAAAAAVGNNKMNRILSITFLCYYFLFYFLLDETFDLKANG